MFLLYPDWSRLGNATELFVGNFYLDENRTFFGGVLQGVSRHSYESLQTNIGSGYSHIRNGLGDIDRVDYYGGATFATNENARNVNPDGDGRGVYIGNFINTDVPYEIEGDFDDFVVRTPLYLHEYGHTFQSQRFGLSYLFAIGIPSLYSAEFSGPGEHRNRRYERQANRWARRYFNVDWTEFEDLYPL